MNKQEKRVGVFMRVYRNEPAIHQAIQSVLEQTYANYKYYVLVNDQTKEILQQYQNRDSRIEIIDGKEGEGFRTYAKAIASENSYVTTIDADDWYEKEYLEGLISFAEMQKVDVAACGNYFVNINGAIEGVRKQKKLIWEREETGGIIGYVYAFFRTIWGKLMKSEIVLNYEDKRLPDSKQYGGYGGDTLFMFNLLYNAKRIGITDDILYNYRVSPMSESYTFLEGRLDADELLFNFVKQFLEETGHYSDRGLDFLYLVYGNALVDTTKLVLAQKTEEEKRAEQLLYIYEKQITKNLLYKERMQILKEYGNVNSTFTDQFYQLIFNKSEKYINQNNIAQKYLTLLEILYPKCKGVLQVEEFIFLSKEKKLMNALTKANYVTLCNFLLDDIQNASDLERKSRITLLQKFNVQLVLNPVLINQEFVLNYIPIIKTIEIGNLNDALVMCQECFEKNRVLKQEEILVELWINLAALLEKPEEFIHGKQMKLQILLKNGKKDAAQQEYEELRQMGFLPQT